LARGCDGLSTEGWALEKVLRGQWGTIAARILREVDGVVAAARCDVGHFGASGWGRFKTRLFARALVAGAGRRLQRSSLLVG
jgi:hypothetical protein